MPPATGALAGWGAVLPPLGRAPAGEGAVSPTGTAPVGAVVVSPISGGGAVTPCGVGLQ